MTRAVITFHSIDSSGSVLSFTQASLARLLAALRRDQVPIVSFQELCRIPRGATLMFDDGIGTILNNALPVLRSFAAPGHLFVVSNYVGTNNRWPSQPRHVATLPLLSWDELAACQSAGLTIESHTANHPDLRQLSDAAVHDEIEQSNAAITQRLGVRPTLFAYPYGLRDQRVAAIVRSRYAAAFTTQLDYLPATLDPASVPRLDSYYLRSAPWIERPLATATKGYLRLRSLLRRLRGSE